MTGAGACPGCLRRGHLLTGMAAHIDRAVGTRAGRRARDILALGDRELARAMAAEQADRHLAAAEASAAASAAGAAAAGSPPPGGGWTICPHHGGLPEGFAALGPAAPRALFGRGDAALVAGLEPGGTVTVVGSRRASAYGREVAFELGRELAAAGLVVISGLANGIDSAAHEGALAGGGPTVAVLGPGADRAYPRSAAGLCRRICAGGAVVSELAPGAPTFRWMFPARNRLMAAVAGLTVVVEAAERSGSLITAEMALEAGGTVGAVPGPINSWRSAGTNRLLADGAAVVRGAHDVLDLLLGPGTAPPGRSGPPISEREGAVLGAVEGGAATADAVASAAALGLSDALVALATLERAGYVGGDHAGRWSRTMLRPPAEERVI